MAIVSFYITVKYELGKTEKLHEKYTLRVSDTTSLIGRRGATEVKADLILPIRRVRKAGLKKFVQLVGDTYTLQSVHTEIKRHG